MRCECGTWFRRRVVDRGKNYKAIESCDRCVWLDGFYSVDQRIISALRVLGEATLHELAEDTGTMRRSLLRAVRRLEASGRLITRDHETLCERVVFGGNNNQKTKEYPHFLKIYRLVEVNGKRAA